jgi:hypothetical protein
MSNIEKRLEIMDEASKAPVTKKGAEKALIETGIIDKKGNILPPYNLVFKNAVKPQPIK